MPFPGPIHEEERKRRDRRRAVTFSPKARVLEIPTVEEMSESEIASIWQTPEENEQNQADLVRCVRAARQNPRDATICTRCIEKLVDPTSTPRLRACRKELINAVLDNQEAQWERGLYHADPEEIRSVATEISRQSADQAITLAAKDEAYVRTMRRREMPNSPMRTAAAVLSTSRSSSFATNETGETEETKGLNVNGTNIINYDRRERA
jgi:hypothetical protein